MADWTDPKTWVTGGTVTAPEMNAHLRDNLLYLYDAPAVAVRLTSAQTITDATDTTVSWDEAVWESVSTMWDVATPSKIIIPRDGVYSIVFNCLWDAGADGTKRASFFDVDGVRRRGTQVASVDPTEFQLVAETNLATDEELEFDVRHLHGSDLDILATRTVCTVRWVGGPQINV